MEEKPSPTVKYYISEVSLIKRKKLSFGYKDLFHFCFTKETTKDANFSGFKIAKNLTEKIIKHIEKGENFHSDDKQNSSVRIQMYEFFFSNALLKCMKVPFLTDTYMISYFERIVRKRDTKTNKNYPERYD